MNINEANDLAEELIKQHVPHCSLAWDNSKRNFGSYQANVITLSRFLVHLNTIEEVKHTILHEIAHALAPGHGHDRVWKNKCIILGIAPNRCYSYSIVKTPKKYEAECCGTKYGWNKKSNRVCRICWKPLQVTDNSKKLKARAILLDLELNAV